ncbi:MAG: protein-disulfide reductase DsbD N-terminal domain-containing protein [Dysgonamonadaceae bacterium]|jgi:hypothetical protein|nr:protein-disulfide reductase DsbD N-terminal domain-containing protein [Dysgonamonadaceae bacterium]
MRRLFITAVCIACVLCSAISIAQTPNKLQLKVLYVGGSPEFEPTLSNISAETIEASVKERMKSFEAFLNNYFTSVTVINAEDYSQEMSANYDVTVMDGLPKPITPLYQDRAKGIYLWEGYLTDDFAFPMLTIGYISDKIGRRIGTKNDWYCLCLQSDAHSWRAEHPIFHGPFEVKMTVVDKPTPEPIFGYPHHFDGAVPENLPMWRVQTYDYNATDRSRIGLVSRPGGYEDSPEAEYISSGVCAKSPDAVAIGRHGNFFHWGFAASPTYLTEEAKPVLANAIAYIAKFSGQTPIARKYNDRTCTRDYAKYLKQFLSHETYEVQLKSIAESNEAMSKMQNRAKEKQARGEKLDQIETISLSFKPSPPMTYEQYLRRTAGNLYDSFGTDLDAYGKYFDENYDYFYCEEGSYDLKIDADAKQLGIPNNDKRLLDEAIKMLESGKDTEKGKRILLRYTLLDFSTPAEWRAWYEQYKDLLFFTESGGWVFLINSREKGLNDYKAREERQATNRVDAGETSDDEPVALNAESAILQDGSRAVFIKMKVHPGYHVYDYVANTDPFIATSVDIDFPHGYRPVGEIKRPLGNYYNRQGTTEYRDEVLFSQVFTGTGNGEVKCKVTYQCCDRHICFQPQTKEISITLN